MTPLRGKKEIGPESSLVIFQSYVFNISAEKAMKYRLGMNPGENINNLIYADNAMLITEESEKVSLKLNIQKTNIMAPSPNRWENSGNSDRLILGAPKSLQMMTAAMKLKDAFSSQEKL